MLKIDHIDLCCLVVYLPLWKYEFVSWDDYSQYMEKWKMFWAANQYVFLCFDVTLASKYGDVWHGHRKKLEFQEQNVDSKQQELG